MSFICVEPTGATGAKVGPSGPTAWVQTGFELRMVFIDMYEQETLKDFKGQRQKTPQRPGSAEA